MKLRTSWMVGSALAGALCCFSAFGSPADLIKPPPPPPPPPSGRIPSGWQSAPERGDSSRVPQHVGLTEIKDKPLDNLIKAVSSHNVVHRGGELHWVRGGRRTPSTQLVESVPLETRIGNDGIASATDVWQAVVSHATHDLSFEEFYFSNMPGESLQPVVDEIGKAAARGVHVRLIIDHGFHATYPEPADSLARLPNIEIRYLDFKRVGGGVQHSKYFTVDGKSVYLGSQNLDWRSLEHIHELGVWIADSSVTQFYQDLFELDWKLAGGADVASTVAASRKAYPPNYRVISRGFATPDTVLMQPSYSPKAYVPDSSHWDGDAVISALDSAKHEVVIQTLTYSPKSYTEFNDFLDQALRRAAARGVHVKLLVSDWNLAHPGIDYMRDLSKVPGIEVRISEVPYFSGGYIPFARVEHCKYFVADSMVTWIGTSNWEPDYFFHTRNVGVILTSRRIARDARKIFEWSWDVIAKPLDVTKEYPKRPHGETPPPGMKKYGG